MKRIVCFILPYLLLLTLSACGNTPNEPPPEDTVMPPVVSTDLHQIPSDTIPVTPAPAPDVTDKPFPDEPDTTVAPILPKEPPTPNISKTAEPPAQPTIVSETPATPELPKTVDSPVTIQLTAGDRTFSVQLYDNPTTQAFLKQLPLTIVMDELHGNEKFYYLAEDLPVDAHNPTAIKTGDLMLYGANCLVLFYKDFSSSYSYTPLGTIADASELADAVGSANVQITIVSD